jgi:hypothetical protein
MTLKQFLSDLTVFFDGKKTFLNSAVLIIVPYLVASGTINADLGAVICGIIGLLTGSGKYVADQAIKNNTDLGQAINKKRGL